MSSHISNSNKNHKLHTQLIFSTLSIQAFQPTQSELPLHCQFTANSLPLQPLHPRPSMTTATSRHSFTTVCHCAGDDSTILPCCRIMTGAHRDRTFSPQCLCPTPCQEQLLSACTSSIFPHSLHIHMPTHTLKHHSAPYLPPPQPPAARSRHPSTSV